MTNANSELAYELLELKEQMKELLNEAEAVMEQTNSYERAKGYWLAQMKMALDDDHTYMGSGGVTMQDSVDELLNEED